MRVRVHNRYIMRDRNIATNLDQMMTPYFGIRVEISGAQFQYAATKYDNIIAIGEIKIPDNMQSRIFIHTKCCKTRGTEWISATHMQSST